MKAKFWTCRCGSRQVTPNVPGTPLCDECGAAAPFTLPAPKGQQGFGFVSEVSGE